MEWLLSVLTSKRFGSNKLKSNEVLIRRPLIEEYRLLWLVMYVWNILAKPNKNTKNITNIEINEYKVAERNNARQSEIRKILISKVVFALASTKANEITKIITNHIINENTLGEKYKAKQSEIRKMPKKDHLVIVYESFGVFIRHIKLLFLTKFK